MYQTLLSLTDFNALKYYCFEILLIIYYLNTYLTNSLLETVCQLIKTSLQTSILLLREAY